MGFLNDFADLFKSENTRTTKNRSFVEDYANSPFGAGFNLLGTLATGALNRNLYAKQTFATSRGLKNAKDLAPITGYGILKGLTTDTGDATSRVIQDTFLGGRGKSGLFDKRNQLFDDPTHGMLAPINFVAGNLVNNSDFNQMIQPGDIIPTGIVAKEGVRLSLLAAKSGKGLLFNAGKRGVKEALAKNANMISTAEQLGKVDVDLTKMFSAEHGRASTVATDLTNNADDVITMINHEPVANGNGVARLDDNSFSDVQRAARRKPDPKRPARNPDYDAFLAELRRRLDEIEAKGPLEKGPGLTINGKPYERKTPINPDLPEPDPRDWTRMTLADIEMQGHPPDIQYQIDYDNVQLLKQVENGWAGANNILGDMANPNMPHILGNKDFEVAIDYYRATMRSGDPAAKRAFESLMDAAYHNTDTTIRKNKSIVNNLLENSDRNFVDDTLLADVQMYLDEAYAYRQKLDDTVRHYNELEGHPLLQGTITENFWGQTGYITPDELKFLMKEHKFTEQQLNTLGNTEGLFSFDQIMRKINNGATPSKIVDDALDAGNMDDIKLMAQEGDPNAAVSVAEYYDSEGSHFGAEEYWKLAVENGHPDAIEGWYRNQLRQADLQDIATRDSNFTIGGMGRMNERVNRSRRMILNQYRLFKSLGNHPLLQENFFFLNFESNVWRSFSGQDLVKLVKRYSDYEIITFQDPLRRLDMKSILKYEKLFAKENPGVKPTGEDILAYWDKEANIIYNSTARPYSGKDPSLSSIDDVPAGSFRNVMDYMLNDATSDGTKFVNSIRRRFNFEPMGRPAAAYIFNTLHDTLAFYAQAYSLTARNINNIRKYVGVPGTAGRVMGDDLSRTIISQSAETRKVIIAAIDDLNRMIDRVLSKDWVFENPIEFNTNIGDALDKGFDISDLVIHSIPGHDPVVIGVSPTSSLLKPLSADDVQMINNIDDQLKMALESQISGEYVDDYVFDSLNYQRNDFIKFKNIGDYVDPVVDVGAELPKVKAKSIDDMIRNFEDALNHPSFINDKFASNDKILRQFAKDLENMDHWELPKIKKDVLKKFFKELKKFLDDIDEGTYLDSSPDRPMPFDSGDTGFGNVLPEKRQQDIISEAIRILEDDGVPDFGDVSVGLLDGAYNGRTTKSVVPQSKSNRGGPDRKSNRGRSDRKQDRGGSDRKPKTSLNSDAREGVLTHVGPDAQSAAASAAENVQQTIEAVSPNLLDGILTSITDNGIVAMNKQQYERLRQTLPDVNINHSMYKKQAISINRTAKKRHENSGTKHTNNTTSNNVYFALKDFDEHNNVENVKAYLGKNDQELGDMTLVWMHETGNPNGGRVDLGTTAFNNAEINARKIYGNATTDLDVYNELAKEARFANKSLEDIATLTLTRHIWHRMKTKDKGLFIPVSIPQPLGMRPEGVGVWGKVWDALNYAQNLVDNGETLTRDSIREILLKHDMGVKWESRRSFRKKLLYYNVITKEQADAFSLPYDR